MSKSNKRNREFKDRQCAYCPLADRRAMRQGRPDYCKFIEETGEQPEIRNGHCVPMAEAKKKKAGTKKQKEDQ